MMNAHCEHKFNGNSNNYFYICGGKFLYIALVVQLSLCLTVFIRLIQTDTVFGTVRSFNLFVTCTHRSSIFQN